jgi:hypothetical protein
MVVRQQRLSDKGLLVRIIEKVFVYCIRMHVQSEHAQIQRRKEYLKQKRPQVDTIH